MVEITWVRHGQANTGAADEDSYDRLSPLGTLQAEWLGEHWAATGRSFDRVVSGTFRRQSGTASAISGHLNLAHDEDPRLNELDYFGLTQSVQASHAMSPPKSRDEFLAHMPQVMELWDQGEIGSHVETYAAFEARVAAMIAEAEALGGRVLYVTSGGVIGMAMRLLLGLSTHAFSGVLLQIHNTSVHRFVKAGDRLVLDCFNAVPHLERVDRGHGLTWL